MVSGVPCLGPILSSRAVYCSNLGIYSVSRIFINSAYLKFVMPKALPGSYGRFDLLCFWYKFHFKKFLQCYILRCHNALPFRGPILGMAGHDRVWKMRCYLTSGMAGHDRVWKAVRYLICAHT